MSIFQATIFWITVDAFLATIVFWFWWWVVLTTFEGTILDREIFTKIRIYSPLFLIRAQTLELFHVNAIVRIQVGHTFEFRVQVYLRVLLAWIRHIILCRIHSMLPQKCCIDTTLLKNFILILWRFPLGLLDLACFVPLKKRSQIFLIFC